MQSTRASRVFAYVVRITEPEKHRIDEFCDSVDRFP